MEPLVTILLAAYNGEEYITDQIESIISQTYTNWKLFIQDDCSTDKTCDVIEKFIHRYENKILLFRRKTPTGSAKGNFFDMLQYAETDYIMTCDQDDVWLPDKIEITLQKMLELENKYGSKLPVLIHTDLKVTDERLNILSPSLISYQKLDSNRDNLNNLLVQNIVTGCTMMVNRALAAKIQNIPPTAIMHDWWCAIVAAAFGHIGYVDKSTVLYRQHNNNDVGAKDAGRFSYVFSRLLSAGQIHRALTDTYKQAQGFMQTYAAQLNEQSSQIIEAYVSIPESNKLKRLKILQEFDFWKTGLLRRFGQILFT